VQQKNKKKDLYIIFVAGCYTWNANLCYFN